MYRVTKLGTIITEGNEVVLQQEGNPLYENYKRFIQEGGYPVGTDYLTPGNVQQIKEDSIREVNEYYTAEIDKVVFNHVQKSFIEGVPIPQHILDRREELKAQCKLEIEQIEREYEDI